MKSNGVQAFFIPEHVRLEDNAKITVIGAQVGPVAHFGDWPLNIERLCATYIIHPSELEAMPRFLRISDGNGQELLIAPVHLDMQRLEESQVVLMRVEVDSFVVSEPMVVQFSLLDGDNNLVHDNSVYFVAPPTNDLR